MKQRTPKLSKERNQISKDATMRITIQASIAGLLCLLIARGYNAPALGPILINHTVTGIVLIVSSIFAFAYGFIVIAEMLMGLFLKRGPTAQRAHFSMYVLRYGGALLSAGILTLVNSGIVMILGVAILSLLLIIPFISRIQLYAGCMKRDRSWTERALHYLGIFVMSASLIATILLLYGLVGLKSNVNIWALALLGYAFDSLWCAFFAPHVYKELRVEKKSAYMP